MAEGITQLVFVYSGTKTRMRAYILDIGLGPRHRPTALFACTMGGQTYRI